MTQHDIRTEIRTRLDQFGMAPISLDACTEATLQIFRTWLLAHAGEHRTNADVAATTTLRSLELIFADEVEQLARSLRPAREPVCKDPGASAILGG